MTGTIYGLGKCSIQLRNADGSDGPLVVLQVVDREGLTLKIEPLGVATDLGSGAGFRRAWSPRKFRVSVSLKWAYALNESWIQTTIDGVAVDLAEGLRQIHNYGWIYPSLVLPHLDNDWQFEAWIDPETPFALRDVKGVLHSDLALTLISRKAVAAPFTALGSDDAGFGIFGTFGGD